MIRVCVFDDNASRREGLKLLVDSCEHLTCVGEFGDCREVEQNVRDCQPDVVLMDIDMPHVNGIEGVMTIKKSFPHIKVLMQTVFEEDQKIFAAICAGADGYILKKSPAARLIDSIVEVHEGGAPMTPVIARKVLELFSKQHKISLPKRFDLSTRELEILKLLVEGNSYKMIAELCFISRATVNTHITHIYEKLQVHSVGAAVAKALQEGLV